MRVLTITVAGLLVISGCNRAEMPAPDGRSSNQPVSLAVTTDNKMLTVAPAFVQTCDPAIEVIATTVSWNATATGTEGVELWLQSPGEEKKLWAATGAVGSGETGPWMRVGSTVTLVDGRNQEELGKVTMGEVPCQNR